MILRGPSWAALIAAVVTALIGAGLSYGLRLEADPYLDMARRPLPPAVAIDRFHAPNGHRPTEAALQVTVMTDAQVTLPGAAGGGPNSYFVPFTAPPGGAGEGEVLGGMILSRQARDAFVQWAVTGNGPELAVQGVAMTVGGLVRHPAAASAALAEMRARGLAVARDPVFLTPYAGRRDQVLAAEAAQVRSNPLPRVFFLLAVCLLLLAVNRLAQEVNARRDDPEPLSLAKTRNTAFERVSQIVTRQDGVGDRAAEARDAAANPAAHAAPPGADPHGGAGSAGFGRVAGRWARYVALWLATATIGWAIARAMPRVVGVQALVIGSVALPAAVVAIELLARRFARNSAARAAVAGGGEDPPSGGGKRRRRRGFLRSDDPFARLHRSVTAGKVQTGTGPRP